MFGAAFIKGAALIAADYVFDARGHNDLGARDSGSSNAVDHELDVFHPLADYL